MQKQVKKNYAQQFWEKNMFQISSYAKYTYFHERLQYSYI